LAAFTADPKSKRFNGRASKVQTTFGEGGEEFWSSPGSAQEAAGAHQAASTIKLKTHLPLTSCLFNGAILLARRAKVKPRRADIALKMAAADFHPKWCWQAGMAIPVRSNAGSCLCLPAPALSNRVTSSPVPVRVLRP
jgi:hypothetical protein